MTIESRMERVAVASVGLETRRRILFSAAATLALAGLLLVLASPAAEADSYPGSSEVKAARAAVQKQTSTVAELDAAIVSLEKAMEAAEVAVYTAQEEYTQAQWENIEAQRQLFAANNRADEAERALGDARADLAIIAMLSYREGGSFGAFEAIMTADGFEDVIVRSEALDRASRDAALVIEQVRAAELVARTMRQFAEEAAESAVLAERTSREAYSAAVEAEKQAQVAFAETQATREEAIARLAQLRSVSWSLESQRQTGLAGDRQARAAREAALWAQLVASGSSGSSGSSGNSNVTAVGGTSVGTAAQGEIAVAFALAQIGEPYVYGAAGPNTWDCSGLTMVAWRTAGVSIPRSSKTQYNYLGKVPYSALRKGDLIFWGTNKQANAVYHATMYIGNNIIVEAPRPGYTVKTRDYRNWAQYNLMPYAGRP
ncbi:MAG: NlpC/P60 family protein [Demequinaceae bacterium]|nr:NlpC/P60 family protein [Demequinaceae bacterium]